MMCLPGGTFALYSLLCRHLNIGAITSGNVNSQSSLSHNNMHQGFKKQSKLGMFIERSLIARRVLFFIAILGMCMLIGDGILTPAISGLFAYISTQFVLNKSCILLSKLKAGSGHLLTIDI